MVSEDDDSDTAPTDADEYDADSRETDDSDGAFETGSDEPDDSIDGGLDTDGETEVTDDEQTWAVVLHASAFAGLVVPFGNVLAPLLVWLIKKDESQFVDESGKEALNFQLTWTMLMLGALLTLLVGIGFLLVPIVAVAWIVLVVLATVRASEKEVYDYPLTVDLIE